MSAESPQPGVDSLRAAEAILTDLWGMSPIPVSVADALGDAIRHVRAAADAIETQTAEIVELREGHRAGWDDAHRARMECGAALVVVEGLRAALAGLLSESDEFLNLHDETATLDAEDGTVLARGPAFFIRVPFAAFETAAALGIGETKETP